MKLKNKIKNFKKGQVAIIVLLVSAVLMTVGLSFSKKTTTETKIDINEESLKKAFNAAESGIDYYLRTGKTSYVSSDNLSSAEINANNIGGVGTTLNFGEYVPANGSEFYWLVDHGSDGNLGLTYYGGAQVSVCSLGYSGSMEINYFYRNATDNKVYEVKRYGYNFGTVKTVSNFTPVTGDCTPTIDVSQKPILVTVTPIFYGGYFYISGSTSFPIQGVEIASTGKAGVIAGPDDDNMAPEVNKRLRVLRRYKFPAFMLSGIVSETGVLSN